MSAVFLKAEWRKLILANYPVDPVCLRELVPSRTELDTWEGDAFVSLVGFQFRDVRVRGLRIPFHTHFPEVNLRFCIRHKHIDSFKRCCLYPRDRAAAGRDPDGKYSVPRTIYDPAHAKR